VNQATLTPTPPVPPGLAWTTLTAANPSLRSWERSAATAGSRGLSWWVRWASTSPQLKTDVSAAVGHGAPVEAFRQALDLARRQIAEAYQEGLSAAEQSRERERAELRRQAVQQAPPPPRRKWTTWNR
jgi:hypothetical protein